VGVRHRNSIRRTNESSEWIGRGGGSHSQSFVRESVAFDADGTTLRGWVYRPLTLDEDDAPLIVMAHGYGSLKEGLTPLAETFAAHGFACLVYDHPNLGESDGSPRQQIDPWAQVRGYRHAITCASDLAGIDPQRIGIWGTSFAGAHVLVVAAVDARVRAVVSQVPLTTHGSGSNEGCTATSRLFSRS